jgi:ubiquinone/menaquinone biosynthesis C-methylase UbiE
MTAQNDSQNQDSVWADEDSARILQLRVKTFYNTDYFDRIILPLLDLRKDGQVLDVGCGYGGLSLLLGRARQDLVITGIDPERGALERAERNAQQENLGNLRYEVGDAHQLKFSDDSFDAVVCQTVLTHVREAGQVVREMARVLKPGPQRDDAWQNKYFRIRKSYNRGKLVSDRGDERLGLRVPLLATEAGLGVFDLRLNDRVLHVIPPYKHSKQEDYLELLEALYASDSDEEDLERSIKYIQAGGGTEEDAIWFESVVNEAALRIAITERSLTMLSAYRLYLTFSRKPKT